MVNPKNIVIAFLTLGWAFAVCATEEAVLWWQVEDPDVTTFHEGVKSASELGVTDARIRVTGKGADEYLMMAPFGDDMPTYSATGVPMTWYASVISPYNSASYSFMIELGNYDYGTGEWTVLATSEVRSYKWLVDAGHIMENWDGHYPILQEIWIPDAYVVPEPSSGILLLIGGGLLALRRKRRG